MASNLFDLTGKVVLATGANAGIGLAFLRGCAKHGADVVIWSRRADRNEAAAEELKAIGAPRVHHEAVDVSDEAAVVAAFESTLAVMGRVDCVFANAGFSSRAKSFPDMTTEMYRALIDVNMDGAFFTMREASRHMRARAEAGDPGGSIVACGSLSLFQGRQGMEHYAAAKSAVAAMIRGLAVEMGQYGVRANMLAPGFVMTEMTDNNASTAATVAHFSKITPLGRPVTMDDLEGPSVYLASDASRFHTGDILIVDGGRNVNAH
jgi:NAD(P)-dependent dehydrogenase (short-subunit alcohol dehydrogenase family)